MPATRREILAVDIGNSRIACGKFDAGVLLESWHHPTAEASSAVLEIARRACETVALSSVVPEATKMLKESLDRAGKTVVEVCTGHQALPGIYETMGADRIANAVAAWKLYGPDKACIIIDLGTATTLTAVDRRGHFIGGFITLGLGQTLSQLHQSLAQLPMTTPKTAVERRLAIDTEGAILGGTILGHVGIIEQWIRIARRQLGGEVQIIGTGGWAETMSRNSHIFDVIDPLLTLRGVYIIAAAEAVPAGRD